MALNSFEEHDRFADKHEISGLLNNIEGFIQQFYQNPDVRDYPDRESMTIIQSVRDRMRETLDPDTFTRQDEFRDILGQNVTERIINKGPARPQPGTFRRLFRYIFRYPPIGEATPMREGIIKKPYALDMSRILRNLNAPGGKHDAYQGIIKDLKERLGEDVMKEAQDYPALKWALAFIERINGTDPTFNVVEFVKDAIGKKTDYNKAVREFEQAESDFKLMEIRINEASANVDKLKDFAVKLREQCPGGYEQRFKSIKSQIGKEEIERDRYEKSIETLSKDEAREEAIKAAASARDKSQEKIDALEKQLADLQGLKANIESLKSVLLVSIKSLPSKPELVEERKAVIKFLTADIPVNSTTKEIADKDVDLIINKLISYRLKSKFDVYSSALKADLESDIKKKRTEKEKAKEEAGKAKEVKFTPNELVYKLWYKYFTTKQEMGGFLPDYINNHWIDDAFKNEVRQKALLATRFAISEAKDQSVLEANKHMAEYVHGQRRWFSRRVASVRSTWVGNKIAMAFGRAEEVSFEKALERLRTIEVGKERPFAELAFEQILTRSDIKKAVMDGKASEEDIARLASYLEIFLKGGPEIGDLPKKIKVKIRSRDAETVYIAIRNLRFVRQEILHKQFLNEVKKKPGSFEEKLAELWKNKWAAEEQIDKQMTEEAIKREFITYLEKQTFDKKKSALKKEIVQKLREGTMTVDDATIKLDEAGFKVGRWTGMGLWSIATGKEMGADIKKGAKTAGYYTIYKPAGYIAGKTWNLTKKSGKILAQIPKDIFSAAKETAGIKKTG